VEKMNENLENSLNYVINRLFEFNKKPGSDKQCCVCLVDDEETINEYKIEINPKEQSKYDLYKFVENKIYEVFETGSPKKISTLDHLKNFKDIVSEGRKNGAGCIEGFKAACLYDRLMTVLRHPKFSRNMMNGLANSSLLGNVNYLDIKKENALFDEIDKLAVSYKN
jgi:hypothetical protein